MSVNFNSNPAPVSDKPPLGSLSDFKESLKTGDVMALVMQVMRESYAGQIEDLRMYAQKVKEFNTQKRLVRDHLAAMRDYQTKVNEDLRRAGIDPTSSELTPEQEAQMQEIMMRHAADGVLRSVLDHATMDSKEQVIARFEDRVMEKCGISIPPQLRAQLDAMLSQNPPDLAGAVLLCAQFIAYLGDMGVKDGQYGKGGWNEMVGQRDYEMRVANYPHITDGDMDGVWADFQDYMHSDDADWAWARGNLHSSDIDLLHDIFDIPPPGLGLTPDSGVWDITSSALDPVNNAWANQMTHDINSTSAELNALLAAEQFDHPDVVKAFGSADAARNSVWGSMDPAEVELARKIGLTGGVPGPGVSTPGDIANKIQAWEDKLNTIGEDSQLANIDLQNALQAVQQLLQALSNVSKVTHDTAMSIIRNIS